MLPQKHITWFLLFSPVPVCLNAQAEPLGYRVLETALKQFITQNILELKEKKNIILILSDQKGNWGAATYVFALASEPEAMAFPKKHAEQFQIVQ